MCTPFENEELVTIREFLACKDPGDKTKTHTFSYFVNEDDHKIAEEILDTSFSSPWEMIRSLTYEEGGGRHESTDDRITTRADVNNAICQTSNVQQYHSATATLPVPMSDSYFPNTLTLEAKKLAEAFSRATLQGKMGCSQNVLSESSCEAFQIQGRHNHPTTECLEVDRKAPITGMPFETSSLASSTGVSTAKASLGIQLRKVFENDEYITFKKIYPRILEDQQYDAPVESTKKSEIESRSQSECCTRSASREARVDPDGSAAFTPDVISESNHVTSTGTRQVLIMVSSKRNDDKKKRR